MKAGEIDVLYENGSLRNFRVHQIEVLRMIYVAVRDRNWGNFDVILYDEEILENDYTFEIKYKLKYTENKKTFFRWIVTINGLNTSEIHFNILGETFRNFSTNRVGFCVLHPIENIAGQVVEIHHADSTIKNYLFPKFIAPHQPFIDIAKMKWSVMDSQFELNFEGDIFETEDQRNWGDASFKTYCTPLHLPYPKTLKIGNRIQQKVVFKANISENKLKFIEKNGKENYRTNLGISANNSLEILSKNVVEKLKALSLSHYKIEVFFSDDNWKNKIEVDIQNCESVGLPLEVGLNLTDNFTKEIDEFKKIIDCKSLNIKALILLSENELVTQPSIIYQIPNLKTTFSKTKIGIGTNYNFTEINRNRFEVNEADFIALSFDPQEHASDDLTILENAESLKYMVESIQELYQKPVHFSPIILKRRFNPYATEKSAIKIPFKSQIDSRQKSNFLAKWTNLVLENLAISAAASATIFQTTGPLGIMDETGNEYPVYQVIKNYVYRN